MESRTDPSQQYAERHGEYLYNLIFRGRFVCFSAIFPLFMVRGTVGGTLKKERERPRRGIYAPSDQSYPWTPMFFLLDQNDNPLRPVVIMK